MSVPKMFPTQKEPLSSGPSIRSQVIVTQYRGGKIFFPRNWVEEVLFFSRHKIVEIPFYQEPIMGVISHHGQLITIVQPLGTQVPLRKGEIKESLGVQEHTRAILLSSQARDISGVAILIDKILGTMSQEDIENDDNLRPFDPEKIALKFFKPHRWGTEITTVCLT